MNITPDYLIERKRVKKSLMKWKVFSLVLILGIAYIFYNGKSTYKSSSTFSSISKKEYIASVEFNDIILENSRMIKKLNKIADNDDIKALIVNVNSPGGSVVGSEIVYNSLRKISIKKPVVALMGSVAASGGYLISLGSDYIICHNGTITGSIGVIMQTAEVTELLERMGIKPESYKSSILKASPNPFEKTSPEAKEAIMENITDVYEYFISLVAERRKLDLEYVRKIADGRIYSGSKAKEHKLVDEIGSIDSARKWLEETNPRKIKKDLEIVEVSLYTKDKIIDTILDDLDIKIKSFFKINFKGISSVM
jgi:protease-4